MPEPFGALLKQWRITRGLSLGALALKAGVGKTTLSYWERGASQPRAVELDAVLDALEVTPQERSEAWARVDAPRAVRRLREVAIAVDASAIPPVLSGDLLRTLRLRSGQTLEQVAHALGVRASTVSRWEHSQDWPAAERLYALCHVLGAHAAEVRVLTTQQRFSLAAAPWEPGPDALDALQDEHDRLWHSLHAGERELMDLRFLVLEARIWPLLLSRPGSGGGGAAARHLLAMVYTSHALWLHLWGREREAEQYAYRSLDLAQKAPLCNPYWLWTVDIIAQRASGKGPCSKPLQAAKILQAWLPATAAWPRFEGWFRLSLANYLGAAGDVTSALELTFQARELVARSGAPLRYADLGHARALLRAGRAGESLPLLPTDESPLPSTQVMEHLLWAETLLAVGEPVAAQNRLGRAYETIAAEQLEYLRPRADAVAQHL